MPGSASSFFKDSCPPATPPSGIGIPTGGEASVLGEPGRWPSSLLEREGLKSLEADGPAGGPGAGPRAAGEGAQDLRRRGISLPLASSAARGGQ